MTVTLGGYPAKQCPRVTHNRYSPAAPPEPEVSHDLRALFDSGIVFETEVTDELRRIYAGSGDLLVLEDGDWEQNKVDTIAAMERGVPVIVNGRLPGIESRAGAPDVLLRWRDGYLPADVKGHQTLSKPAAGGGGRSTVTVSPIDAPHSRTLHTGRSNRGGHWRDDAMQLAHYTRMLQTLGLHAGGQGGDPETLIGAIIGTSSFTDITGHSLGYTWYDLTAEDQETYSASNEKRRAKRSALQRYDHEFDFRLKVAAVAKEGGSLVRPLRIPDCDQCVWAEYCRSLVPADDASFNLEVGQLNAREWLFLYPEGGGFSISDLARVNVAEVSDEFKKHSVGTRLPAQRLSNAVRRAAMTVEGRDIEPLDGDWPAVPTADVEVDYDIEWDTNGRVYQWGLRIRDGQDESTARYEPVYSFAPMDEEAEAALAAEFAEKISDLATQAEAEGKSLAIYHWHHVEVSLTRRFEAVAEALEGRTIDLLNAWFDKHLFSRKKSSIKAIAPLFGFKWSVQDAGGFYSQEQVAKARAGDVEAQRWCLDYNESDVAAQAAIRDGIRKLLLSKQSE